MTSIVFSLFLSPPPPIQVASTLAALFLGVIVLAVISLILTLTTVLPIMGVYGDWFWPWWFKFAIFDSETMTLGFLASLLVNFYLLLLLVRFVFRVSPDDHGLQKRGMFHIFDTVEFLFYILNALLGLAKRAITSILFQVLFIGRMDKSLMPRKHELWDKSYVSYLGYMQLDLYYSHPILLTSVYEFLKMTAPLAAQRRSDVNVANLRSSSGSWLRRVSSEGSSGSIKSNAVFRPLPSSSNTPSTHGSPRLEMRRLNVNGDADDGGDAKAAVNGNGNGTGASPRVTMTKLKARHHPTRGDDDDDAEDAGKAQLVPAAAADDAGEGADALAPASPSSPNVVSPTSLSPEDRAKAARRAAARLSGHARQVSIDSTVCVIVEETMGDRLRRRRVRNRWLVAYTLLKNPLLMYERRTDGVPTHLRPKQRFDEPEVIPEKKDEPETEHRPRASSFRALLASGANKAKAYAETIRERSLGRGRAASNPFAIDGFVEGNEHDSSDDDRAPLATHEEASPAPAASSSSSSSSFLRPPPADGARRSRPISFAEFAEEDGVMTRDVPSSEA